MASLPVYFEQRPIGTIHVDASGPSFTYAPGWIGLREAGPGVQVHASQTESGRDEGPRLLAIGPKSFAVLV